MNEIEIRNLTKSYGEQTVLKDVSVSFEKGKIHGLVGRNGSGKTVLMKCICGLTYQDQGEILFPGCKGKARPPMGIIIEEPGFLPRYSGFQNLWLLAQIRRTISKEQVAAAMELVGLDPKSRKHVGKYSMGMRQRLGIAQAMMEEPELLLLDEPFNGLDKNGVAEIRSLLLELKKEGKTILLASHNEDDIRILCDRVYEMDGGILRERTMEKDEK